MAKSGIKDRLCGRARAFDRLLTLIPAKIYYGEDTDDQTNQSKMKSSEIKFEASIVRRMKFDPDNKVNRNVKEVMDEKARKKQKLVELQEDQWHKNAGCYSAEDDIGDEEYHSRLMEGVFNEPPRQISKKPRHPNTTRILVDVSMNTPGDAQNVGDADLCVPLESHHCEQAEQERKGGTKTAKELGGGIPDTDTHGGSVIHDSNDPTSNDAESRLGKVEDPCSKMNARPRTPPPSTSKHSATVTTRDTDLTYVETISGINDVTAAPAMTTKISMSPKHVKDAAVDMDALRARLAAKIEALRATRKADGPDGRPIRTRQELIESRREKQAERQARRVEIRRQARLEAQKQEESLIFNPLLSPSLGVTNNAAAETLSFGQVTFKDGARLSHDLSYVHEGKKKGPSDPKTALHKLRSRKRWLAAMGNEKHEDIEMNDAWVAAKRQVLGEKVPSEPMLTKAVKRKKHAKQKSKCEWRHRTKLADQMGKAKQRKREENIRKRRNVKASGKAGKRSADPRNKSPRPGFEGSFGFRSKR